MRIRSHLQGLFTPSAFCRPFPSARFPLLFREMRIRSRPTASPRFQRRLPFVPSQITARRMLMPWRLVKSRLKFDDLAVESSFEIEFDICAHSLFIKLRFLLGFLFLCQPCYALWVILDAIGFLSSLKN